MAREEVDHALADLGERMGMPGLRLDGAGACQLLFDQRWLVTLLDVPSHAGIALNCPVTTAAEGSRLGGEAMRAMLQASFHGLGGVGTTLAMGPDERPYLQRLVPVTGSAAADVQRAIELLLDQAETWSARLARPEPASHGNTPAVQSATDWAMQRV